MTMTLMINSHRFGLRKCINIYTATIDLEIDTFDLIDFLNFDRQAQADSTSHDFKLDNAVLFKSPQLDSVMSK